MATIRQFSMCSALSIGLSISSINAAETYALDVGESGASRLDMQSEFMHEVSSQHLEKAGLTTGQIVVDAGCGTGYMTAYMASLVGPEGHVYAIDASVEQLSLAKNRIDNAHHKNVTFIQADMECEDILSLPKVDLIYSRFFLMHLKNPSAVLKKMGSCKKRVGKHD